MKQYNICLAKVPQPPKDCTGEPVMLTDATVQERLNKVLQGMKERSLEQLVVYGDAEHCGNFQYLMGYFTRFEESLLVLDADGTARFVLGNENLNKASKARIPGQAVHVSLFSLPNQPNREDKPLRTLLEEAGIAPGRRIGIAGWKHFTSPVENNEKLFDIPAFILDAIRAITGGNDNLFNAGDLFLGEGGARTTNNANEIAHYEYGAALASDGVLDAMNLLAPGVAETALGAQLNRQGQHNSIVTIAASGPRFIKGNMFPTQNTVKGGGSIARAGGCPGCNAIRAA